VTFSALDSALTGPLFATDAMRDVFSDRNRMALMLRVEAALAGAEAAHGLAPKALAGAIARIKPADLDIAGIGEKSADSGVAAVAFVKALEARLPENLRSALHRGATSQDIVDTALVLQLATGLDLVAADLSAILDGLSALVKTHRRTVCVGRSYGQHAAPITFGYAAGVWLSGIADVAAHLPGLRDRALVASLGGPVGTLAGLGNKAEDIGKRFAQELGLGAAAVPWHSARGRMVAVGAWLAELTGALAKMATDVAFLSATEVGEVAEPHSEGRGGSSSMPHKRNPVSSAVILAAHMAAPGLVGTLLAAMAAGQQRPVGAWQAEWHALPQLFGLASGALREGRRLAEGLVVDKGRMRANLDLTHGLIFADAASSALAAKLGRGAAQKLVAEAANAVRDKGIDLREALAATGADNALLATAFDLKPSIEAGARIADRAVKEARTAKRLLTKRKS
jgi:3-carboxy-cis,cis-muconate cycloisomerase